MDVHRKGLPDRIAPGHHIDLPWDPSFMGRIEGPTEENPNDHTARLSFQDEGVFAGVRPADVPSESRRAMWEHLTDKLRRDLTGKLDPVLVNSLEVGPPSQRREGFDVIVKIPEDYGQSLSEVHRGALAAVADPCRKYINFWGGRDKDFWTEEANKSRIREAERKQGKVRSPYRAPYDPVMAAALSNDDPTGDEVSISRVFDQGDPDHPGVRATYPDGTYAEFYPDSDDPESYVCQRYDSDGTFLLQEESSLDRFSDDIAAHTGAVGDLKKDTGRDMVAALQAGSRDDPGPLGTANIYRPPVPGGNGPILIDYEGGGRSEITPSPTDSSRYIARHYDADGNRTGYSGGLFTEPDRLLSAVREQSAQQDRGFLSDPGDREAGAYYSDSSGALYKVTENEDGGGSVVMLYDPEQGEWSEVAPEHLSGTHRSHVGEIARSGAASGHCVLCGRPLKGESAAKGIGPKCAAKYSR